MERPVFIGHVVVWPFFKSKWSILAVEWWLFTQIICIETVNSIIMVTSMHNARCFTHKWAPLTSEHIKKTNPGCFTHKGALLPVLPFPDVEYEETNCKDDTQGWQYTHRDHDRHRCCPKQCYSPRGVRIKGRDTTYNVKGQNAKK